jgi:hypothetical protein
VLLSFYGPNVVALATTVLALASNGPLGPHRSAVVTALALAGVIVVGAQIAATTLVIARCDAGLVDRVHRSLSPAGEPSTDAPPAHASANGDDAGPNPSSAEAAAPTPAELASWATSLPWVLAPMVESARDPVPQHVRLHVVEDIAAAVALGVIGGLGASGVGAVCKPVALASLVASLLHAAYVLLVRPYKDRLEQAFAALLALAQCALSGAITAVVVRPGQKSLGALRAAAWITVGMNAGFYLQMIVLAVWEFHKMRALQRRLGDNAATGTTAARAALAAGGDYSTGVPLLAVPTGVDAVDARATNPLERNQVRAHD